MVPHETKTSSDHKLGIYFELIFKKKTDIIVDLSDILMKGLSL